jgi:hypothetical protein
MKQKLQNWLNIHLELCIEFYNYDFFILQNFQVITKPFSKWQGKCILGIPSSYKAAICKMQDANWIRS